MTLRPCKKLPSILSGLSNVATSPVSVRQLLLPDLTTYARVLNPVWMTDNRPHRWVDMGARPVDSRTQWTDLLAESNSNLTIVREPATGSLDSITARELNQVLATRTSAPDDCFFLVWEGYGGLLPEIQQAITVEVSPDARRMHILKGRVTDAVESIEARPSQRLPMWWIPADGAWCVGNDIYGRSVFVGGTEETISVVVADAHLEAYLADETQLVVPEDF